MNMKKLFFFELLLLIISGVAIAQQPVIKQDSLQQKILDSVTIIAALKQITIKPLPDVKGTYIFAGKKSEVINLDALDVNRIDNTPRQIFAKVAGVYVYETDGTGNQVNIATRALTAHRSWEMNVRHNGIMTNSDLYGYPASHFNAPTQSIERIEIVRGSGSLQYGAQFGGMINYITKEPDTTRKFSFETQNAAGSYGLLNTFNAAGGKINKLKYYTYFNYRRSNGYRENSEYKYYAGHVNMEYNLKAFKVRLEYNLMHYVNHLNGGLNDAQFYENPRQSTRKRNYYSPTIHVPSIQIDYTINKNSVLNFTSSAILGSRNSVQFIALSTVKDTFNTRLNSYNPRQVDIDRYNSYANEVRLLHHYNLFNKKNTLAIGIRYINNNLIRFQAGKGTTGFDYDLTLTDPAWGRDLTFKTRNISIFAENLMQITSRLSATAGIRYENGETNMSGTIKNFDTQKIPVNISHRFALAGFGVQYSISQEINVFANWAQAYRPVIFADIIPVTALNKIDANIKDARGSNSEIGIRGKIKNYLNFDITFFNLNYRNRAGNLVLTDNTGQAYFFKTNVGNSRSRGIEFYAEVQPVRWLTTYRTSFQLSIFSSTSYIHAVYTKGTVVVNNINKNITGNFVEAAPQWTSRNGIQLKYKGFSTLLQYSYVGKTFADALNTVTPNISGTVGVVPSYKIFDWNFTWRFLQKYNVKLLMNNLFNRQYFTERPSFFPGPGGLYPSDGRSFIVSVGAQL